MFLLDAFVSLSPVAAYYSQLNLIQKSKSLGTFSIDVCAILLISGILRVFFWFTTGYALNLLFQALFIIAIQVNTVIYKDYSPEIMHVINSCIST